MGMSIWDFSYEKQAIRSPDQCSPFHTQVLPKM